MAKVWGRPGFDTAAEFYPADFDLGFKRIVDPLGGEWLRVPVLTYRELDYQQIYHDTDAQLGSKMTPFAVFLDRKAADRLSEILASRGESFESELIAAEQASIIRRLPLVNTAFIDEPLREGSIVGLTDQPGIDVIVQDVAEKAIVAQELGSVQTYRIEPSLLALRVLREPYQTPHPDLEIEVAEQPQDRVVAEASTSPRPTPAAERPASPLSQSLRRYEQRLSEGEKAATPENTSDVVIRLKP